MTISLSARAPEQPIFMLAGGMVDSYQLIVDDYHLASAHPFKALDFLFSRADLAFHVLVATHINFSLTIRNKSAVAADKPNIISAETTLVGALFAVLCA